MLGKASVYYISSYHRADTNESASDFVYNIPNYRSENNYDSIALLGCNIPKSYYLIESRHKSFTLTEGLTDHTITLTEGNYSLSQLGLELQTQLNLALGFTYAVVSSKQLGKYAFSVSGNLGVQPSFTFTDRVLAEVLGFDLGSTSFVADSLVCPNVVNLQRTNSLLLTCDYVGKNGVLQDLYSTNESFSNIVFQQADVSYNAKELVNKQSSIARFRVVDFRTDEIMNLQGHEIQLTIVMFQRNSYYTMAIRRWIMEDAKEELLAIRNEDKDRNKGAQDSSGNPADKQGVQ